LHVVVADGDVLVGNQNSSVSLGRKLGNALAGQKGLSSIVVDWRNIFVNFDLGAVPHAEVWGSLTEDSVGVWLIIILDDGDLSLDGRVEWNLVNDVSIFGLLLKEVLAVNAFSLEVFDDSFLSSVTKNSLFLVNISRAVEKASLLDKSESLRLSMIGINGGLMEDVVEEKSSNVHLVLGQSSGFVSTDLSSTSHGLRSVELLN
jgi:hypothetical protein